MALPLIITFTIIIIIIIIIITEIEVGDVEVGAMPFNIFIRLHTGHFLYSLLAAITELFMATTMWSPVTRSSLLLKVVIWLLNSLL
jgi:hypothetical protein